MTRILNASGGKGIYTAESPAQYQLLSELARERGVILPVLLRLSSGNQFGMSREDLEQLIRGRKQHPEIKIAGLHYFSGTQKKRKKSAQELQMLDQYAAELLERYNFGPVMLEYGAGLPVSYFREDPGAQDSETLQDEEALDELHALKERLAAVHGFSTICVELGRFLAAVCGSYLTTVKDVKSTDGMRVCITDGGIHQLNYDGQIVGMKLPYLSFLQKAKQETGMEPETAVCGALCTTNDILYRGSGIPPLQPGDILVFERCGAYSACEGMSLFLSRELPRIVLYSAEKGFETARDERETACFNAGSLIG